MPIPYLPNTVLYVDFIEMPKYGGYNFVFLMTDSLTRFTQAVPCTKQVDSEGTCKLVMQEWVQRYNLPAIIHSDQDIRIKSSTCFYQEVLKGMGVEVQLGVPYHSESHGQVGRENKSLNTLLRINMQQLRTKDWLKVLPLAMWQLNNVVLQHGFTAYELFHGKPSWDMNFPNLEEVHSKESKQWAENHQAKLQQARETLKHIRARA